MTHQDFEERVRRLEGEAARNPAAYRVRVVALAALGYGYVTAAFLVVLALLGAIVASAAWSGSRILVLKVLAKLGWPMAALALAIARAAWVRFEPPPGVPLERAGLPRLFAALEEIRSALRAPHPHRVLLTDECNAAVVQLPRFGMLGGHRNYVVLGLPLMQALSNDQFRAVIAHEFGHLSAAHGRLGAWIYRLRQTFARLHEKLEGEQHWASFVFLPFFRWYAPRFNAYSFVQARAQEYEADRASAEAVGARTAADALVGVGIGARFLDERYWERVWRGAEETREPVATPYSSLGAATFAALEPGDARAWLDAALVRETTVDDTHPCLRERLAALGEEPRVPPAHAESAARALLGGQLPALAQELDRRWRAAAAERWAERFDRARSQRERIAQLDAAAGEHELPIADAFERAAITEDLRGSEAALPLYREVVARDEAYAPARFALGRILAGRGDARGLEHLDASMDADPGAILPACRVAYAFLMRAGNEADAQRYAARARDRSELLERAREERASVRIDGRYTAHGLAPAELTPLVAGLRALAGVERAWLVRRELDTLPESPLFVLGVRRREGPLARLLPQARKRADLALQERLRELPIPGESFILVVNHRPRSQRRLFESVAGSSILETR